MLKLVRQQHENGCVPASIATLAGIPYSKALKLFWSKKNWSERGTSYIMLLRGLKKAGFKVREKKPCLFSQLKSNAVLIIKHSHPAYEGALHAVVWDHKNKKVLDPYPNKKRLLKRHLPLKSYEKSIVEVFEVR